MFVVESWIVFALIVGDQIGLRYAAHSADAFGYVITIKFKVNAAENRARSRMNVEGKFDLEQDVCEVSCFHA